jgi:hypothetical protein
MTTINYQEMSLNELRQYVLTHREDVDAFHHYIDRSKSEGRMITLDVNDSQWEEKVKAAIKEAIRNSSQAIRWYCNRNEDNRSQVSTITNWWEQLDHQSVIQHHVTGMEVDRATGIWEPTQLSAPRKVLLSNPHIDFGELTALVKYQDQEGSTHSIEAVAIDLDSMDQKLFVWSPNSAEVFIFSVLDN